MALRSEYSLGHSEFNDFLFASVGEEESGAELSVLSALARLDMDPWSEAARLSELTREAATSALAATLQSLPDGGWKTSEIRSIAVRLVAHLPRHGSSRAKPSPTAKAVNQKAASQKPVSEAQKWLLWIGLAVAVLMVLMRLFGE